MSAGGGSTNSIDQLIGAQTGGPTRPVSSNEISRIRVSANIVRQNYSALEDFVDGKIDRDALFIVHNATQQEAIPYLYGHVHNYLSSLYSFNEQMWEKVNAGVSSHPFPKSRFISGRSRYSEKLAYIRGLRHDVQHGEYGCLSLDCRHSVGNFKIYCIEFDEQAFKQGSVDQPHDHLRHTNQQDRQYPLPYIADFHKRYFNDFVDDSVDWLQGNP
jgi:hypothetical protein